MQLTKPNSSTLTKNTINRTKCESLFGLSNILLSFIKTVTTYLICTPCSRQILFIRSFSNTDFFPFKVAQYGQQLQNMNEKLNNKNELNIKEVSLLNQQLEKEKEEKLAIKHQVDELQQQKSKIPTLIWILIIAGALFLGWLIGRL